MPLYQGKRKYLNMLKNKLNKKKTSKNKVQVGRMKTT
jgi:hypothetical protein